MVDGGGIRVDRKDSAALAKQMDQITTEPHPASITVIPAAIFPRSI